MAGRPKTDETKDLKRREYRKSPARGEAKSPSRGDAKSPARVEAKSISRSDAKSPARAEAKSPSRAGRERKSPARLADRTDVSKSPAKKNNARPKSPARPRSPARSPPSNAKGRGRPKSPGRTKSPARIKRSKSRSPARKSPKRPVREAAERGKIQTLELDSDSDVGDTYGTKLEKPKAAVRGRTRRLELDNYEKEIEDVKEITSTYKDLPPTAIRRSTRLQEERVVHLKNYDAFAKLTEFSDDDDLAIKPTKANDSYSKRDSKINWGRRIGSIYAILLLPLFFVALHLVCNEDHCSFTKFPSLQKYRRLSAFFDLFSFLVVIGYSLILAILSAIPFGGRKVSALVNKLGKLDYVMNGLLSAVILLAAVSTLEFYNVPVSHFVRTKYLQLAVASTAVGMVIGCLLYVRSFYVPLSVLNPNALTNDAAYNFVVGRETNPRIFGVLDLKMFFIRYFSIAAILINFCFLLDSVVIKSPTVSITDPVNVWKSLTINPSLTAIVFMQCFVLLDHFIFEHCCVSTFENQYEGLGYLFSVVYGAGPFIWCYVTKYVLDYGVQLSKVQLALTFVPYLIGYVLYRGSNWQKSTFRQNPYDPKITHLESIPTGQGKKLLISGYWGIVRHPNYLGDILMNLSWVPFVLCYPPVLVPYLTVAYLIHRTVRDGKRCRDHYGPSWERYCNRVKYVLIPKVY